MAKRTSNPATSTLLLVGGAALALYLFAKSSSGDGGSKERGEFSITASQNGTIYCNGKDAGPVSTTPTIVSAKAGVPLELFVVFADGTQSETRTVTAVPGPAAAKGGSNPDLFFTPKGVKLGDVYYDRQRAELEAKGDTARATATAMLAEAAKLVRSRQYEAGSAKYGELIATYAGTPEAKAALGIKALLDFQLKTTAGRAALDRANPI